MTTTPPQASKHACFTSNASLRPGHHVIVLHETERLFFNIGLSAIQGNPSGTSSCFAPWSGNTRSPSDVGT